MMTNDPNSNAESTASRPSRRVRRRRRRRRRRAQAVAIIPSLFTLGNLIAGFAAIYYASRPLGQTLDTAPLDLAPLTFAGMLIFIGMFFDAIDGYIARLTGTTSEFGAALDSLADIVTFGVAPAYMTLQLVSHYYLNEPGATILSPDHDDLFGRLFWVVAAIYVSCTAMRLARFNVETSADLNDHLVFRGLPSPGAAGCLASLAIVHQNYLAVGFDWMPRVTGLGMSFIMLLCALAMVSNLPYVHVVNRYMRGHGSFGYVVRLSILLVIAIFAFELTLAVCFTAYALSAPIRTSLRWRRHQPAPIADPRTET